MLGVCCAGLWPAGLCGGHQAACRAGSRGLLAQLLPGAKERAQRCLMQPRNLLKATAARCRHASNSPQYRGGDGGDCTITERKHLHQSTPSMPRTRDDTNSKRLCWQATRALVVVRSGRHPPRVTWQLLACGGVQQAHLLAARSLQQHMILTPRYKPCRISDFAQSWRRPRRSPCHRSFASESSGSIC